MVLEQYEARRLLASAPGTNGDHFWVDQSPFFVAAPGVLRNDGDPDGDVISAVIVVPPEHGDLTLNEDGSFTYIPEQDYRGTDAFYYKARDGELEGNASIVQLNVALTPVPSILGVADLFAMAQGATLSANVHQNDWDPQGLPLFTTLIDPASHGTLDLDLFGRFTYTPDGDFIGTDTFTYKITNLQSTSATTTVTIRVVPPGANSAPAADDDLFFAIEGNPITVSNRGVLRNDTDAEGDTLEASVVDQPQKGALVVKTNGEFQYQPTPHTNGIDQFTYRAADGQATSNLATTRIWVLPVNDPPTFEKAPGENSTDQSGPSAITNWAGKVAAGPADEQASQSVEFEIVGNTNTDLFAVPPRIDPDGKLSFTPQPNATGKADITVFLKDNGGTDLGGDDTSATKTFSISVFYHRPWHNRGLDVDVLADGKVVAEDVIKIINYINAKGSGDVPQSFSGAVPYLDTDADDVVAASDALKVINYINAHPDGPQTQMNGEGESDVMALLAMDVAAQPKRKR
jgi:hypothetical protein